MISILTITYNMYIYIYIIFDFYRMYNYCNLYLYAVRISTGYELFLEVDLYSWKLIQNGVDFI